MKIDSQDIKTRRYIIECSALELFWLRSLCMNLHDYDKVLHGDNAAKKIALTKNVFDSNFVAFADDLQARITKLMEAYDKDGCISVHKGV